MFPPNSPKSFVPALLLLILVVTVAQGSPRILHGFRATQGQFKFVGIIVGARECGCTLIKKRTVLTAGHCVEGLSPSQIKVALGGIKRSNLLNFDEIHDVESIKVHPKFYYAGSWDHTAHYDVAIVKLKTASNFPTVALNTNQALELSGTPTVVGWGEDETGSSGFLEYVKLGIVQDDRCPTMLQSEKTREVCAGNGWVGACDGDSGGPLLARNNGQWVQIGITSYAPIGCQTGRDPSVFASVKYFYWWITNNA